MIILPIMNQFTTPPPKKKEYGSNFVEGKNLLKVTLFVKGASR